MGNECRKIERLSSYFFLPFGVLDRPRLDFAGADWALTIGVELRLPPGIAVFSLRCLTLLLWDSNYFHVDTVNTCPINTITCPKHSYLPLTSESGFTSSLVPQFTSNLQFIQRLNIYLLTQKPGQVESDFEAQFLLNPVAIKFPHGDQQEDRVKVGEVS